MFHVKRASQDLPLESGPPLEHPLLAQAAPRIRGGCGGWRDWGVPSPLRYLSVA